MPASPGAGGAAARVSIVIVSYNCRQLLARCLQSLAAAAGDAHAEVIVVDNASGDGTAAFVAEAFPHVRLLALERNLGFGRGCNAGARLATAERLLLLNPDTEVRPGAIAKLLRLSLERPEAGIWGGRIVGRDGRPLAGAFRRFPTLWSTFCEAVGLAGAFPASGLFNRELYGRRELRDERPAEVISGCFLLIRADLWHRLGGFDPLYFMYSEEVDLCLRARALGARPLASPEAEVLHHVGGSQPCRADRLALRLRGAATYMRRHWSPPRRAAGRLLLRALPLTRWLALRLSARLGGGAPARAKSEAWREVWARRADWIGGYGAPEADDGTASAPGGAGLSASGQAGGAEPSR